MVKAIWQSYFQIQSQAALALDGGDAATASGTAPDAGGEVPASDAPVATAVEEV